MARIGVSGKFGDVLQKGYSTFLPYLVVIVTDCATARSPSSFGRSHRKREK